MLFKQALENIETLFLFDMHSQRKLRELAQAADPGSQDWRLLRTTEVAIFFYNHSDGMRGDRIHGIQSALKVVGRLKRSGADRLTITMALRLEMDLLATRSAFGLETVIPEEQHTAMFTKFDQRALEVGEALLEHFPSLNPLPVEFHRLLCPLMPPYQREVLNFYRATTQKERVSALTLLLKTHQRHLVALVGMLRAKRMLASHKMRVGNLKQAQKLFSLDAQTLHVQALKRVEGVVSLAVDLTLPNIISIGRLAQQIVNMRKNIQQLKARQAPPDEMADNLLTIGILLFLHKESEAAIEALVEALEVSNTIPKKLKRQRKNCHALFADIPFMIGVSYLRIHGFDALQLGKAPTNSEEAHKKRHILQQAARSFLQAITLEKKYSQAYANLGIVYALQNNQTEQANLFRCMLQVFGHELNNHSSGQFINLAVIAQKNKSHLQPSAIQWALISILCNTQKTQDNSHFLQELRTLYTLKAHRELTEMYRQYTRNLKVRDPDFVAAMGDPHMHSAVLFYIAHGYCFFMIQKQQNTDSVPTHVSSNNTLDYSFFHRSIVLNADAIYYDNQNVNAKRLAQTHKELLETIWKGLLQGWQEQRVSTMRGATLYQEMLQVKMLSKTIGERLQGADIAQTLPQLDVSVDVQKKINQLIRSEHRSSIQRRAEDVVGLED